jgi:hypothetical protein
MRLYRSIIWLLVLGWTHTAVAQVVTVRGSFGADSVMIGEQTRYRITVESADDVQIGLPVYSDTLSREIEILQASDIDTTYRDGRRVISQEYLVTSFDPGWNTVPPQPVTFRTAGFADTVYTTALLLTVLAPDVDPAQPIKPIKPPVNTPLSLAEILPWLLYGYGAILVIAAMALLAWYYFRKKKDPEYFAAVPAEPAHLVAFRDLQKLEKDELPKRGMIKEYYTRLTEIIRVYITRQFDIHAMERTTSEILGEFAVRNTGDRELTGMLEGLLMLADLVKFAKEDPSHEENVMHLRNAMNFVEKTYRMFYTVDDQQDKHGEERDAAEEITEESEVEPVKLEENNG